MKPAETVRFTCEECQIVFDLCVAPVSEWPEDYGDDNADGTNSTPTCCPFCGSGEVKAMNDTPVQVTGSTDS